MNSPFDREPNRPGQEPPTSFWRKCLSALGVIGVAVLNFGTKLKGLFVVLLKFGPAILKSSASMFLMIGVYGSIWGWRYAIGFVGLLLLHECGHLIAAKAFNLDVGAPVFIPFMGAFIALREAPRNVWVEAWVGIGGPLLGTASAMIFHGVGVLRDFPLLIALASTGYWLNLFNMIPVGTLDGGRITRALSPWLWVPGFGIMGWMVWQRPHNFILWLVLLASLPRVISLFRKRDEEEQRYLEITSAQRWVIGSLYFGLIALLAVLMHLSESQLSHLIPE